MAYEQNLSRGLQSAINNTPIEDGKLRFAVDTARLYLDLVNERIEFTDFVRGLTKEEIIGLTEPLPKMYLSSDTHELYFYHDEKWITFGGGYYDELGQLIHKTYIKGVKFDDDFRLITIRGDGLEIPVENDIISTLLEEVNSLRNDYNQLREEHDVLVEATTKFHNIEGFADINNGGN